MTVRYYICQKLDIGPVASRVSLCGGAWVETTRLVEHPNATTREGVTISVREEFGPIYSKSAAVLMLTGTSADIPPRHPGYERRHLVPLHTDEWEIIERHSAGPTLNPDTVPPAAAEDAVGHWLFGASAVTLAARDLEDRVYGADSVSYGRAAQHIMGIRRRIAPDCIETVPGRGWMWVGVPG